MTKRIEKILTRLIIIVFILIILISTLYFLINKFDNKNNSNEIRFGAILPLTGPGALIGQYTLDGMELAVEEINSKGGIKGQKINLIVEDSKTSSKEGISAYEKLVNLDKVDIVFSTLSSISIPLIEKSKEDKIPLFMLSVSTPKVTEKSNWAFRYFYTAETQTPIISEFAYNELNLKKIAILHLNDEFGFSTAKKFKEKFEILGGEITLIEKYDMGEKDFSTHLIKIKENNPDALYYLGFPNHQPLIIKQIKENKLNMTFLTMESLFVPEVMQEVCTLADGFYSTSNYAYIGKNQNLFNLKTKINQENKFADFTAFAYDSIKLVEKSIEQSNKINKKQIKDNLINIKNFNGTMGEISVSSTGDVKFPEGIAKLEACEIRTIKS